jgi:hypothetical protein
VGAIFLLFQSLDLEILRNLEIFFPLIFLAVLVGIVHMFWMGLIFFLALGSPKISTSTPRSYLVVLGVFGKTWMSRYFPVKGAWVVHRLGNAKRLSVSKAQMATGTALESFAQFFGLAAVGSIVIATWPESVENPETLVVVFPLIAVAFFVLGSKNLLGPATRGLSRLTGVHLGAFSLPSFSLYSRVAGAQIVNAFLWGLSTALVATAVVGPLSMLNLLFVIGVTAVANLLGIISVFAPAGIGVKEAILVFGLQNIMSLELAVVVAVLSRLLFIIIDVLFFFLSQAVRPQPEKA